MQAIAELRDALHEVLAVERVARGAHVVGFDLDHVRVDGIHELTRRALGHEPAAIEDGEAVAALRLVHVVRRHQDRGAADRPARTGFPRNRDGSADRRRWSARRAAAARARAASRPPARAAASVRRSWCRRAARAGPQVVLSRAARSMRSARSSRVEPEDAAHEIEVLQHREVFPQREALGHVADLVRSCSASRGTGWPSTVHSPSVGRSSPHSMRIVVDLPEPFGPRKP